MVNFDIYNQTLGNGSAGSPNAGDSLDTIRVGANLIPSGTDSAGGWSFATADDGHGIPYLPRWAYDMGLHDTGQSVLQGYTNTYTLGNNIYAGNAIGHVGEGSQDGSPDFFYIDPSSWIRMNANSPQFAAAHTGQQSALNGTPYDRLDGSGNVIGNGTFSGLFNKDHVSDFVAALAGAALTGGAGLAGMAGAGFAIPKIANTLGGMYDAAHAPSLSQLVNGGTNMPTQSFGGLSSLFGGIGNAMGNAGNSFMSGLGSLFNGDNIGNTIGSIGSGILGANQQGQAADKMLEFLKNQQQTMQNQTAGAQQKFMDFLTGQQSNLTNLANQSRDSILGTLNNQQSQIGQLASQGRDNVMNWLNGQQANINNLYNPGTPEYNLMKQEMENKDAAAGRNSQYGTRAVELAGKLAQIKGDLNTRFATGVAGTVGNAQGLPANLLNQFATGTDSTMAGANNLPATLNGQFAQSAVPSLNNNLNQAGQNTLQFTTGTSRALADALNLNANRFNSLLSGIRGAQQGAQGPGQGGAGGFDSLIKSLGASGMAANPGVIKGLSDLFGGVGTGLEGGLNSISDNGFAQLAAPGSFAPTFAQQSDIFSNLGAPALDLNTVDNFASEFGDAGSFIPDNFDFMSLF